jgi:hypothetical protein
MNAQEIIDAIDELDERSEREEYLDTQEAWDLLVECKSYLKLLPETER